MEQVKLRERLSQVIKPVVWAVTAMVVVGAVGASAYSGGTPHTVIEHVENYYSGSSTQETLGGDFETNPVSFYSTVDVDGGAFTFNESGADLDARFEGDTDTNLLRTDAGNDRIGVGTSTPAVKVHVVDSTITTTMAIGSANIGTNEGHICVWNGTDFSIMSFADSSTTLSVATSTACN